MPFYLPKPQAEKSSRQVLVCKNSVKLDSPDHKPSPASYKDNDTWEYPVLYFYVIVEIKRAINAAQNRRNRRRETRNMAVLMKRAEVSAGMKEAPQAEPVTVTIYLPRTIDMPAVCRREASSWRRLARPG